MTTTVTPAPQPPTPGSIGSGEVPLIALLGWAKDAFIAEFDRRLATSQFCSLSLAHSRNVLRHLGAGPLRASQLVDCGDVSKQAISQQLVHLQAKGFVRIDPDPGDQRARIVALTAKGAEAQVLVQSLFQEIEADWARLLDDGDAAALRRVLSILHERVGAIDPSC